MSDFLYSSEKQPAGRLVRLIESIYPQQAPSVFEFHGDWGSIAVSRNLYHGFMPIETADYICIIVGGPILTSASNKFLAGPDSFDGTQAVFKDVIEGNDAGSFFKLSGPFAIISINKAEKVVRTITDMMGFIPVYCARNISDLYIGTHTDILAALAQCKEIDKVSLADFVLHGNVTFPHTFYAPVKQLPPATVCRFGTGKEISTEKASYWSPTEECQFRSVGEAADALRTELADYIRLATRDMDRVACLISGGEDSRVILSLLPAPCERHGFMLVDTYKRECDIARRCCALMGAAFDVIIRGPTFENENYQDASRLIGSGWEPGHVRLGIRDMGADLDDYDAVFGGYLSDSLIKAHHVKKLKILPEPFFPQMKRRQPIPGEETLPAYFSKSIAGEVRERRRQHYNLVKSFRPDSAAEWSTLWPATMRVTFPTFLGHRKLIRSFEPFMSAGVVKIAAACPQQWKLNRRLFHRAAQPLLEATKWLPHADGRMPYFPWTNIAVHSAAWSQRLFHIAREKYAGTPAPGADESKSIAQARERKDLEAYLQSYRDAVGLDARTVPAKWPLKYRRRLLGSLKYWHGLC